MKAEILKELILQSLEHEMGGVKIYETALQCAQNEDLKEEWERYHEETQKHVDILRDVCTQMHYDPDEETPGRKITREKGEALVAAMESALEEADEEAAQVVACESVLIAELVDHTNWQLIGSLPRVSPAARARRSPSSADRAPIRSSAGTRWRRRSSRPRGARPPRAANR